LITLEQGVPSFGVSDSGFAYGQLFMFSHHQHLYAQWNAGDQKRFNSDEDYEKAPGKES
jgi:hypothetical protein